MKEKHQRGRRSARPVPKDENSGADYGANAKAVRLPAPEGTLEAVLSCVTSLGEASCSRFFYNIHFSAEFAPDIEFFACCHEISTSPARERPRTLFTRAGLSTAT